MDYSITDLMKAASMMSKKYFGRQDEYTISFTKEDDGCWYVDYPDWPFDHHNLMMVEGADDLCELLSYDGTSVLRNKIPASLEAPTIRLISLLPILSEASSGCAL